MEFNDEQLKKLSAALKAELALQTDNNTLDSPESKEKIKKIVDEQMLTLEAQQKIRASGEFDYKTFGSEKVMDADAATILASRNHEKLAEYRDTKMLTGVKMLELREGKGVGQKIEEFKQVSDTAYLVASVLYEKEFRKDGARRSFMEVYRNTKAYHEVHNFLKQNEDVRKALAVASAGYGAEWVPTGFSSQVQTLVELELRVASLFNTFAMPTNPYKLPVQTSMNIATYEPEQTADEAAKITAATPGTGGPTFTAKKVATRVVFSEEIDEDSIVAIRNFAAQEIAKAIGRAQETGVINGDKTTAAGVPTNHQDNKGTAALFTSAKDARLMFDGLRYYGINNADTSKLSFASYPSDAKMLQLLGKMKKWGVSPTDLAIILPVNTYLKMLGLTNVVTLDKYGPNATILTGELLKYSGIPVVVSEYAFSNLNASGVYDGSVTNLAQAIFIWRPGFQIGTRGGVTLGTDINIQTDQVILVAKRRFDFVSIYNALLTGNTQVAYGYAISTV